MVERVLAHGDTKSSVMLWGGFQADLRLVPADQRRRGAPVLHRIESAQHRAARPRHPARLQAERIRPLSGRRRFARGRRDRGGHLRGARPRVRPAGTAREPRRDRGGRGPHAAPPGHAQDLRGDLHMHTTATDGRADAWTMARAARDAGLEYIAITDHSQALAMANGLDETAGARARRPRSAR